MPKKNLDDLCDELYAAIPLIKSGEIDVETAKAIALVAQVLINAKKLKVDFIKHIAELGEGFAPVAEKEVKQLLDKHL